MTPSSKRVALNLLQSAQERLFDIDQLVSALRITRDTAEVLHTVVTHIKKVDEMISEAVENLV